jgi:hypothetical protein
LWGWTLRVRASVTVAVVLLGVLIVGGNEVGAVAATATLVNESFTGATTNPPNWTTPAASVAESNDACLTGSTTTSQTPLPGCATGTAGSAGLQLTTSQLNQEGGVAYTSSVPSSLGLDVTFNSYQYAGTGADGIVFFLAASDPTNASSSPLTLGPAGGHLGYSPDVSADTAGLTNGYLGIGLDVYGNYTNSAFDGSGCQSSLPQTPESITVRGPGSGTTGYCELTTSQLSSSTLDSASAQSVPVEVAINPTDGPLMAEGGFSVPANNWVMQAQPIGATTPVTETGTLPDDTAFAPDPSWVNSNGVPQQLSFGWSASTGASTDFHTISQVAVQTLNGSPPALGVTLTDNSGGTARTGQTVTYTANASVTASNETRPITMSDTLPADLTPQSTGLGGTGWTCPAPTGQTVTCTHPAAAVGALPAVAMPVQVAVPAGSSPVSLADTVTVGSPDAVQGSATDTETYAPAPTATALSITGEPVDTQVNAVMDNPDGTTTHITVAAVKPDGTTDPTYTGTVTLGFANNPGNAKFLAGGVAASTLTASAVNGVADFSPIIINAVGFGDTLTASAAGLTSATTTPFTVAAAATGCPTGQICSVNTNSPTTGQSAVVQAQAGAGNAIITATYGGNVAVIHPCTGSVQSILTFSGNRAKVITLTFPASAKNPIPAVLFCYGQPTPFLDILYQKTTFFSQANQDYEGLLPVCLPKFTGPCVKSITLSKTSEKVVIDTNAADPHVMG